MSSVMNSPMMQNIMSNPDFMRNMMESNPQMRQLLETNPELRHILDDPEMMRRSMEMMRDPSAMQNAMRNQDLAMSQIENLPGGFNALRRMYEDVQEPMMDAMSGGAGGGSSTTPSGTSNTNHANSGAAGTAMPNPWATNANRSTATNTSASPTQSPFGNIPMTNPWAGGASGGNTSGSGNSTPGMPGGMPGAMPSIPGMPDMNMDQALQMLENPMMQQMMNQMMADPNMMNQMMQSNPMLRQLRETNPQMAAMMSNPETIRSMMNPDNLRAMMQMQNAMQQLGGSMPGFPTMPGAGAGFNPPTPPAGGLDFSSILNQLEATSVSGPSTAVPSPQAAIPPEQRFRVQLQSLNDMGFDDNRVNVVALQQTHGNVNRAVDMLLTNPPAPLPADNTMINNSSVNAPPPTAAAPSSSVSTNPSNTTEDAVEKDEADKKND
jgi:ubiquilin